ncbi:MAG: nicotinate (nicotinamide) nucleotide adenylyltransferase [Firmicutes bacterium]|nr:nicotinate (nicotinamide) nucleotide adenylyltransferase [Bacillota bacterium]
MVIVFGGAFNPPTIAHKEIYFHIEKEIHFSKFIYLPVSNLYTKRSLSSNYHRLQMLELLIKDLPKALVSSLEFDDSDYKGTYQSLLRLQEKYPDEELAFVIGADNLYKLHKWINAKSLLSEFKFIVINRANTDIHSFLKNDSFLKEYLSQFIILPHFNQSISSTAFRETFDPEYVTPEIYDYVMQNELYRG